MKFLKTYFNDVKIELRKVTWLSKNEMLGSTMVVWVFAIIVALFLFVVDFGIAEFISRLLGRG
ncbi:MAG: preprotein translocase subunit SecE [Candidatus Marinimicrobia bacterium]|nr:preprotein translocase subunit SecE [Candidatus Neomarinimicrobiota bacterium]|tara:strand:- start:10795 stop:10983 length:189 start_codon:yes stop_codon:yes gene_type:complete